MGPAFCLEPPVQANAQCTTQGMSSRMYYYDDRSQDCEKIWLLLLKTLYLIHFINWLFKWY